MYFQRHFHENKDLPIYFNRQIHTPEEPIYEMRWHETGEWIFINSGAVELRVKDTYTVFSANDLIFIANQAPHTFRAVDGPCDYFCLIPDNSILRAAGIDTGGIVNYTLVNNDRIKAIFREIVKEFDEKKEAYAAIIKAKIAEMTALLIRHFRTNAVESVPLDDNAMRITKDAIAYMEAHYAEDFSGEALAAHLGFSRSYLCHVINKVTGHSLTENLLYIRCCHARDFLRQGYSVGEAAYMAGFKNASYFCRTYKRMMGEPPSAHRRK